MESTQRIVIRICIRIRNTDLHEKCLRHRNSNTLKYHRVNMREQRVQLWHVGRPSNVVVYFTLSFKGYSLTDPWIVCNRCIKDMHDERYANYISYGTFLYEFTLTNVPYQRFLNAACATAFHGMRNFAVFHRKPRKIELNAVSTWNCNKCKISSNLVTRAREHEI